MTETPPEPGLQAVPPNQAYTTDFITLSNIRWTPAANAFTVVCDTDVLCKLQMDYWSHNDPSIPQPLAGTVGDATARFQHTFTTPALPAGDHTGKFFGFSIRLDATDVTGRYLRSQQGFVQLIGARTVAKGNAVPVRHNTFGDGTRPANGGAVQGSGAQSPYLVGGGNWSSYTWAQYNPKGTVYPAP